MKRGNGVVANASAEPPMRAPIQPSLDVARIVASVEEATVGLRPQAEIPAVALAERSASRPAWARLRAGTTHVGVVTWDRWCGHCWRADAGEQ